MRCIDPVAEEEYDAKSSLLWWQLATHENLRVPCRHRTKHEGEMVARKPSSPYVVWVWDIALRWLSAVHITTSRGNHLHHCSGPWGPDAGGSPGSTHALYRTYKMMNV